MMNSIDSCLPYDTASSMNPKTCLTLPIFLISSAYAGQTLPCRPNHMNYVYVTWSIVSAITKQMDFTLYWWNVQVEQFNCME